MPDRGEQQYEVVRTQSFSETVSYLRAKLLLEATLEATLKPKLKLHKGTLLVISASHKLLVCSSCRGDERPTDDIVVCNGDCGRGYHMSCAGLKALPEDDWFCHFCSQKQTRTSHLREAGQKQTTAPQKVWWKRSSGSCGVWERMHGDDPSRAVPRVKREQQKVARRATCAAPRKKVKVEPREQASSRPLTPLPSSSVSSRFTPPPLR